MKTIKIHIVAPKEYEVIKNTILSFDEKDGEKVTVLITGWDYDFSGFAYWTGGEIEKEPDIILIFDRAYYPKVKLNTGALVEYEGMIECLKYAKLKLDSRFILIFGKDKEENIELLNEIMKLSIQDFFFAPQEFGPEELKEWIFSKEKTIRDNKRYLLTKDVAKIKNSEDKQLIKVELKKTEPKRIKQKLSPKTSSPQKSEVEIIERTQVKEVIRDVVTTKHQVIAKTKIKSTTVMPHDYKKTIGIVGASNTGKTFILSMLIMLFSSKGKKVAGLDFNNNHDLFYFFDMEAGECALYELLEGKNNPFLVNENISIYTVNPNEPLKEEIDETRYIDVLNSIKNDNHIVLIETDHNDKRKISSLTKLCNQVIFLFEPDLLKIKEQVELFETLIRFIPIQNIIIVVNRYNKGITKANIRKLFQKKVDERQFIKEIYTIGSNPMNDKQLQRGIAKRSVDPKILDKSTRNELEELAARLYPIKRKPRNHKNIIKKLISRRVLVGNK